MTGAPDQAEPLTSWPPHAAVLFGSPREFASAITPFVRHEAAEDRPMTVIAGPTTQAALRAALGPDLPEPHWIDLTSVPRALGPAFEWFTDLVRTSDGSGDPGGSFVVEHRHDGRSPAEVRELMRYDSLANDVLAGVGARMVCAYDSARNPAGVLDEVERTHPFVLRGDQPVSSGSFVETTAYLAPAAHLDAPPPDAYEWHPPFDLSALRAAVGARGRRVLGVGRVADLVFAVNEAIANAHDHGDGPTRVALWVDGGCVVAEVEDRGPGFADDRAGYFPPADPLGRGRGLWLTRRLCDLVEIRTGAEGSTVRIHVGPA